MKSHPSEKLLIEEIMLASRKVKIASRGLAIGSQIKYIRTQLGISQNILAKRAGVPQSTISRIEQGQKDTSVFMLKKVLEAISCDLVIAPVLRDSTELIRRRQARKIAEKRLRYLIGTMNLEDQQPDSAFIEELLKQEEDRLLLGPDSQLWEE